MTLVGFPLMVHVLVPLMRSFSYAYLPHVFFVQLSMDLLSVIQKKGKLGGGGAHL